MNANILEMYPPSLNKILSITLNTNALQGSHPSSPSWSVTKDSYDLSNTKIQVHDKMPKEYSFPSKEKGLPLDKNRQQQEYYKICSLQDIKVVEAVEDLYTTADVNDRRTVIEKNGNTTHLLDNKATKEETLEYIYIIHELTGIDASNVRNNESSEFDATIKNHEDDRIKHTEHYEENSPTLNEGLHNIQKKNGQPTDNFNYYRFHTICQYTHYTEKKKKKKEKRKSKTIITKKDHNLCNNENTNEKLHHPNNDSFSIPINKREKGDDPTNKENEDDESGSSLSFQKSSEDLRIKHHMNLTLNGRLEFFRKVLRLFPEQDYKIIHQVKKESQDPNHNVTMITSNIIIKYYPLKLYWYLVSLFQSFQKVEENPNVSLDNISQFYPVICLKKGYILLSLGRWCLSLMDTFVKLLNEKIVILDTDIEDISLDLAEDKIVLNHITLLDNKVGKRSRFQFLYKYINSIEEFVTKKEMNIFDDIDVSSSKNKNQKTNRISKSTKNLSHEISEDGTFLNNTQDELDRSEYTIFEEDPAPTQDILHNTPDNKKGALHSISEDNLDLNTSRSHHPKVDHLNLSMSKSIEEEILIDKLTFINLKNLAKIFFRLLTSMEYSAKQLQKRFSLSSFRSMVAKNFNVKDTEYGLLKPLLDSLCNFVYTILMKSQLQSNENEINTESWIDISTRLYKIIEETIETVDDSLLSITKEKHLSLYRPSNDNLFIFPKQKIQNYVMRSSFTSQRIQRQLLSNLKHPSTLVKTFALETISQFYESFTSTKNDACDTTTKIRDDVDFIDFNEYNDLISQEEVRNEESIVSDSLNFPTSEFVFVDLILLLLQENIHYKTIRDHCAKAYSKCRKGELLQFGSYGCLKLLEILNLNIKILTLNSEERKENSIKDAKLMIKWSLKIIFNAERSLLQDYEKEAVEFIQEGNHHVFYFPALLENILEYLLLHNESRCEEGINKSREATKESKASKIDYQILLLTFDLIRSLTTLTKYTPFCSSLLSWKFKLRRLMNFVLESISSGDERWKKYKPAEKANIESLLVRILAADPIFFCYGKENHFMTDINNEEGEHTFLIKKQNKSQNYRLILKANHFKSFSPENIELLCNLCIGRFATFYEGNLSKKLFVENDGKLTMKSATEYDQAQEFKSLFELERFLLGILEKPSESILNLFCRTMDMHYPFLFNYEENESFHTSKSPVKEELSLIPTPIEFKDNLLTSDVSIKNYFDRNITRLTDFQCILLDHLIALNRRPQFSPEKEYERGESNNIHWFEILIFASKFNLPYFLEQLLRAAKTSMEIKMLSCILMGMIGYEIMLNSEDKEISPNQEPSTDGIISGQEQSDLFQDDESECFIYERSLKSKYRIELIGIYQVLLKTVLEGFLKLIKDTTETRNFPLFSQSRYSNIKSSLCYLSPKCIDSLPETLKSTVNRIKEDHIHIESGDNNDNNNNDLSSVSLQYLGELILTSYVLSATIATPILLDTILSLLSDKGSSICLREDVEEDKEIRKILILRLLLNPREDQYHVQFLCNICKGRTIDGGIKAKVIYALISTNKFYCTKSEVSKVLLTSLYHHEISVKRASLVAIGTLIGIEEECTEIPCIEWFESLKDIIKALLGNFQLPTEKRKKSVEIGKQNVAKKEEHQTITEELQVLARSSLKNLTQNFWLKKELLTIILDVIAEFGKSELLHSSEVIQELFIDIIQNRNDQYERIDYYSMHDGIDQLPKYISTKYPCLIIAALESIRKLLKIEPVYTFLSTNNPLKVVIQELVGTGLSKRLTEDDRHDDIRNNQFLARKLGEMILYQGSNASSALSKSIEKNKAYREVSSCCNIL